MKPREKMAWVGARTGEQGGSSVAKLLTTNEKLKVDGNFKNEN